MKQPIAAPYANYPLYYYGTGKRGCNVVEGLVKERTSCF